MAVFVHGRNGLKPHLAADDDDDDEKDIQRREGFGHDILKSDRSSRELHLTSFGTLSDFSYIAIGRVN
jgi:hypothetical protein